MNIAEMVQQMAKEARGAARILGSLSRGVKDKVILRVAELLGERRESIQAENLRDVTAAKSQGYPGAFLDRLTLTPKVMDSMVKGLKEVAALPDPVGAVTGMWVRPNGLKVGRQRIPLGVIGFIYESRPNVTVDAAALCLKSGNAVILKGGKEALHSNLALTRVMQDALAEAGLPGTAVQVIPRGPAGHPGAAETG
jgi:glutamate-5-semialdehyde dehydrogenase